MPHRKRTGLCDYSSCDSECDSVCVCVCFIHSLAKLHRRCESLNMYQSETPWEQFGR